MESYKLREGDNERGIAARLTLEAMARNGKGVQLQSADQLSLGAPFEGLQRPHAFPRYWLPGFYLVGLVCKGVGTTCSGAI